MPRATFGHSDEDAPATSATDVAETLRQRIIDGSFAPGQQLKQDALSASLGVSRTPVREALALLARDGLLLYAAHRGYSVRAFSARDTLQAWEMRCEIEAVAAGLCARDGIAETDEAVLAECLSHGDDLLAPGPLDMDRYLAFRAMNLRFHNAVALASGNPWVSTFLGQLANVPMSSATMFFDWEDYENVKDAHRDHHRIVEAILARDIMRARHLIREHLFSASVRFQAGYGRTPRGADHGSQLGSERPMLGRPRRAHRRGEP